MQPDGARWVPIRLLPSNEQGVLRRDAELRRMAALQALGDAAYQYIAEVAARICRTPMAAITLLTGDTLRFQATAGFAADSVPVAGSPCRLVMDGAPEVTVLDDLEHDARCDTHPLVRDHPGVRCCIGAPLITSQGVVVGTVCVADTVRRQLSPVQLRTLQLLARQTALLLETRAPSASS